MVATSSDIPRVVDMAARLASHIGSVARFDRSWTAGIVARLISQPEGVVFVTGMGFIAGSIQPTVISPDPVAMEMGWFAEDRSGIALLRSFEDWSQNNGAVAVRMSTGPAGLDLSRLGYILAERTWVKAWPSFQ